MLGRFTQLAALGALLALFTAGSARAQDSSVINLGVGTQKVITVPGTTRIALGDPNVAEVKAIGGNQILISGTSEGNTTLLVWKSSGQRVS